jgi:hypothetical protein
VTKKSAGTTLALVEAAKNIRNVAENSMPNGLQEKAEEIISKLSLNEKLEPLGEAHLVGNVALRTTVKPDIDFQIYAEEDKFSENAEKVKSIMESSGISEVVSRELKQSNKVLITGIYYEPQPWTVDVSITVPQDNYLNDAYAFYKVFSDKFNEVNRKTTVSLKKYFLKRKMLWNGMSYYIYRAVLDEDCKNPEDIFGYLKKNNINISRFKRGK